jgi:hypothetical protein
MTAYWKASGLPLTAERVREFLSYEPETGFLRWIVPRPGRKPSNGNSAGSRPSESGGRAISIDAKIYTTARIAWLYAYGEWPIGDVYHKNGDKFDDRLENLEDSQRTHKAIPKGELMTAEHLKSLVRYEPETGEFFWKARSGKSAGHTKPNQPLHAHKWDGYAKLTIEKRIYRAHRLAWLYTKGEWPPKAMVIDHINGIRDDNRLSNLRLATRQQNSFNRPGAKKRASSHKGVYRTRSGKWEAKITLNLGCFDTEEEAVHAFKKAALQYHGEFAWQERSS